MQYVYSGSPQIRSGVTTRKIMMHVCIALLPSCIAGCIFFGWGALLTLAIAVFAAVASEVVYRLCCIVPFKKIFAEFDFTSAVTGLLVGMNAYADSKWYAVALASVFAVVVAKMIFGGTGKNVVNPAIVGRIFAFISFGAAFGGSIASTDPNFVDKCYTTVSGTSQIIGATPMQALYSEAVTCKLTTLDLFLGNGVYGSIGEVCKLALIVGGIYLIAVGVLNFRWPLVYLAVTGVATFLINGFNMTNALNSLLSGGLMLGAIFMATDYVTTPATKTGNYIYFVALGVLTAVLRQAVKGEAVSFAILLMNFVVPLIDNFCVRRPFGFHKPVKEVKA